MPLFIIGALSQYLGAAVAVGLFGEMGASGVAGLRIVFAALLVLAWRQGGVGIFLRATAIGRAELIGFGLALATMNVCFYVAIDYLPLGTAVAIEFLGPVVVAALGARTRRSWFALGLVAVGAFLMANVQWAVSAIGVMLALAAATGWACYIVIGRRVAANESPVDALAVSFSIAALAVLPLVAIGAGPAFGSPRLLGLCLVVGLLSSVVPYRIDQWVLRAMSASAFALIQAALPVMAMAIGVTLLGERPSTPEVIGFVLVVAGIATRETQVPSGSGGEPA